MSAREEISNRARDLATHEVSRRARDLAQDDGCFQLQALGVLEESLRLLADVGFSAEMLARAYPVLHVSPDWFRNMRLSVIEAAKECHNAREWVK